MDKEITNKLTRKREISWKYLGIFLILVGIFEIGSAFFMEDCLWVFIIFGIVFIFVGFLSFFSNKVVKTKKEIIKKITNFLDMHKKTTIALKTLFWVSAIFLAIWSLWEEIKILFLSICGIFALVFSWIGSTVSGIGITTALLIIVIWLLFDIRSRM